VPSRREYLVLHVDLFVRSMKTALEFYLGVLGFTVFDDTFLDGPLIQLVSDGHYNSVRIVLIRSSSVGAMIELQEFQADSALTQDAAAHPLRKGWISLLVPDLQAHIDSLREHDVNPISEIFNIKLPRSRLCKAAVYQDPDGNDLEFLQVLR
jgi:hypothetical protein